MSRKNYQNYLTPNFMFNILLIGAGQLGSRYLQGLVGLESKLSIVVVDALLESLETAKTRWTEVGGDDCDHDILWLQSIPSSLKKVDIVFVVTSSMGRADLVAQVASQIKVRFWVLEKVLAQSVGEVDLIISAVSESQGAWVNNSRRMMTWHQSIKNALEPKGPIKVTFSGGLWGLACNSIHFIDLVSWWTGEKLESIDTSGIDHKWFESKRASYFEVTGNLIANFSGGTTLQLKSKDGAPIKPLQIELGDGLVWNINELKGTADNSIGSQINGRMEFQSQLSGRLVNEILFRGQCDLPMLEESSSTHKVFLNALLKHWNISQSRDDFLIPIT